MSTTMTAPTSTNRTPANKPTTVVRVLHSEWVKARTLRSTWITTAATLLVIIGFGLIAARMQVSTHGTATGGPGNPPGISRNPLSTVLTGANLALLIVAVWGATVGAREYATGMIRTTMSAAPKRLPVLWGKLASFGTIVVPTLAIALAAAFFAGMRVLSGGDLPTMAWGDAGVARAVLGMGYYILGIGLIGLALGVLLRATAAAIGTVIGAVLFLPALASALLPTSWDTVLQYLPSNAGESFTTVTQGVGRLAPGAGALVFTAWVVVAIAGAAVALQRRDV